MPFITEDGMVMGDDGSPVGEEVVMGDEVGVFVPYDTLGEQGDMMGAPFFPTRGRGLALQRGAQYQRGTFGPNRASLQRLQPWASTQGCNISAQQCAPSGRLLPIGFDSVIDVAIGATAIITQRPQILFQPSRIVISASLTGFFLINDVKVGKNSQFVASGALPAAVFSELSVGVALAMDAAQIAQDITLVVTNIDVDPHRFTAAMIGESCEGSRLG